VKGHTLRVDVAIYDVFAEKPFCGNQAAVVRQGLYRFSDTELLALAGEISLAETALYSRRGSDLMLRFANADRVLERCGHASLACVADYVFKKMRQNGGRRRTWSGHYRVGSAVAEWSARLARVHCPQFSAVTSIEVALAWPERPRMVGDLPIPAVYQALGLEPMHRSPALPLFVYNSGNFNALVPVKSLAVLERAKPNWAELQALFEQHRLTDLHIYCLLKHNRAARKLKLRCRNVFPYGIFEESATGTASVALAAALADHLPALSAAARPTDFLFEQGVGNRRGKLRVRWCPTPQGAPAIWLEGRVFPFMKGRLICVPNYGASR
jgi:PhzF family phenazine biosynthesis protein